MDAVGVVVGEALVDVVDRSGMVIEYPGGSAANVAVALSRLDRPVWFATAFAEDRYGEMLRSHLADSGVRLGNDPAAIERTSSAQARIADDGSASYVFDMEWRLNPLVLPDGADPVVMHTCSLAAVIDPGAAEVRAIAERLRGSATITYDLNARPAITGTGPEVVAKMEQMVALSDLAKASDEDLEMLYPGRTPLESAEALKALGPAAVLVTLGGQGAFCVSDDGVAEIESEPVEVADTIGAGDTFQAGLIDALWTHGLLGAAQRSRLAAVGRSEWADMLSHAAKAAAVTVSRPGADPPYRHELGE